MKQFKTAQEFFTASQTKNIEFLCEVTRDVLKAIDLDLSSVEIFSTPDLFGEKTLVFSVHKTDYKTFLNRSLHEFEKKEMYEFCAFIKKYIDKLEN